MINKLKYFALASMLVALTAASNAGATVVGLYSTGMNGSLSPGDPDPSWSITSAPVGVTAPAPAYVITPNDLWVDPTNSNGLSKWIGPINNLDANTQAAPPTLYVYQTSFSVTSPTDLYFSYSVDNYLLNVRLTGPTSYLGTSFGTSFDAFSAPVTISNLQVGSYIMEFTTYNAPTSPFQGPTGLRVQFSLPEVAAPEPTTYAGLGAMLALGLLIAKKRQSRKFQVNG